MNMTVQVAQRGVITLPKPLRDAYNIQLGDIFTIIDLGDGKFLLSRTHSQVDDLCNRIRSDLMAEGETLESMLQALRTKRERNGPVQAAAN